MNSDIHRFSENMFHLSLRVKNITLSLWLDSDWKTYAASFHSLAWEAGSHFWVLWIEMMGRWREENANYDCKAACKGQLITDSSPPSERSPQFLISVCWTGPFDSFVGFLCKPPRWFQLLNCIYFIRAQSRLLTDKGVGGDNSKGKIASTGTAAFKGFSIFHAEPLVDLYCVSDDRSRTVVTQFQFIRSAMIMQKFYLPPNSKFLEYNPHVLLTVGAH